MVPTTKLRCAGRSVSRSSADVYAVVPHLFWLLSAGAKPAGLALPIESEYLLYRLPPTILITPHAMLAGRGFASVRNTANNYEPTASSALWTGTARARWIASPISRLGLRWPISI